MSTNLLNRLDIYSWMIVVLAVFAAAGAYTYGIQNTVPQILVAVVAANAFDIAANYIKTKKFRFTKTATITGMFIGELLAIGTSDYLLLVTVAAIAIASKHIINIRGRHIFNPTLFALFVTWLVFSTLPSWWGSFAFPTQQFSWLNLLAVAVLGVIIMVRQKRYDLVLPFVGVYVAFNFAGFLIMSGFDFVAGSFLSGGNYLPFLIDSTTLFAAMFMLVEPKTSPLFSRARIFYGVLAAAFFVGFTLLGVENVPLFALLAANLFVLPLDKYLKG